MDYSFIGWNRTGTSDKIWVSIEISVNYRNSSSSEWDQVTWAHIWGRRGRALQFKTFSGFRHQQLDSIEGKTRHGYRLIQESQLDEVYPEFQSDLEKTALWAMLAT